MREYGDRPLDNRDGSQDSGPATRGNRDRSGDNWDGCGTISPRSGTIGLKSRAIAPNIVPIGEN
jgi:hypothetical protein